MNRYKIVVTAALCAAVICLVSIPNVFSQDDDTRNILKQGLLGAGTGAIASSASGGNAGKGALIGAGTNIIGGALLDTLTAPSQPARRSSRRSAPPPQDDYYDDQGGDDEYYEEAPPQESSTQKVLKQGLLGAGTGAIASGMSGGDAGEGALIGAGTNVIGGALLDTLTAPAPQPRRVYRRPRPRPAPAPQPVVVQQPQVLTTSADQSVEGTRKKIVRKYDENGKVTSEEEIYY